MKYIRTKDGRIIDTNGALDSQLTNHNLMRFKSPNWHHNGYKQITIKMDNVIEQANTIEELCDEFVETGNGKPFLSEVRFEHWDKQTKNILNKQGIEIYGAIWTGKGLIYVAKMNSKGELELL